MKMSKTKQRKELILQRKKDKYGYFGLFRIEEVYPFQMYMQRYKHFKLAITQGNELIHMIKDGLHVIVWYDEKLRQCCSNRYGMCMWYVYHTFDEEYMEDFLAYEKEHDIYYAI